MPLKYLKVFLDVFKKGVRNSKEVMYKPCGPFPSPPPFYFMFDSYKVKFIVDMRIFNIPPFMYCLHSLCITTKLYHLHRVHFATKNYAKKSLKKMTCENSMLFLIDKGSSCFWPSFSHEIHFSLHAV